MFSRSRGAETPNCQRNFVLRIPNGIRSINLETNLPPMRAELPDA